MNPSISSTSRLFWFLLFVLPWALSAQPIVWRWSNPRVHGANIAAMAQRNGWVVQVAERGQIYVSRSLDQWVPRDSSVTNALRGVTFFGEKIVIAGEAGLILVADSISPLHRFQRIDLQTPDWLEGIAASSDRLVAVGDNGAIYTSSDATVWIRRPQSFSTWLRSVAFGNGQFVAVGDAGFIASSSNGEQWSVRPSTITDHLNRVVWIQDRFIATGDSGRVLSSPDGASWQSISPQTANPLYTAAGQPHSLIVAGKSDLHLRENNTWIDQIRGGPRPAPDWTYLSSIWDSTLFLLGGRSGRLVEGFRTNATSAVLWVERQESVRNWIWDIIRTPEFYVAVGDRATLMTSEDGIRWELEVIPDSMTNTVFLGVGGSANRWIAIGNRGRAVVSSNGVVWDPVALPTDNDLQGVAFNNGLFVLTGGNGTILTSPNATTWQLQPSSTTAFLSSITAFPGGFMASGSGGTLLRSADGRSWSRANFNTTNWIYKVRWHSDTLVAVGQNGTILTSPDGITWTSRSSGTSRWLNDSARIANAFFVAGNQGTILRSVDAAQWTNIGAATEKSLFALASHQGQLVAAGLEGSILRSQIIPDRTPIRIHSFQHRSGENLFLFSGNPDQRFTLDRTLNLSRWATGSELEFLDGSGTLLHLEPAPANSDKQFYRGTLR